MAEAASDDPGFVHVERLVESIDLPIGRWDPLSHLTFCNARYAGRVGRRRDQLLGRTLSELFGTDAWEQAQGPFAQAFSGKTVSFERLVAPPGAGVRREHVRVFPDVRRGERIQAVYTIELDPAVDLNAANAAPGAQRRLARLAENIPHPLTYVDRDFVIRFANRAYMQATGMTAAHLIGRPIGQVRGSKRWAEHRQFFERARAGETCEYTRLTELAHLGPRWVRTTYSPDFDERGEVIGIYTSTIDVHELKLAQQALKHSAEHDALTDVLSRRALMERIEHAALCRAETPAALFFVDLDRFKLVNDESGHRGGDALLVTIATELKRAVRAEDAVGRFGGDEFVVVAALPDVPSARVMSGNLLRAVRRGAAGHVRPAQVTASIGFALTPADAQTAFELVRRADDAMYVAKRQGGDRAVHCAEADAS